MRRFGFFMLLAVLSSCFCREVSAAFYYVEEPEGLPSCQNRTLLNRVVREIEAYQLKNPPSNLVERRKQKLLLKNLEGFELVDSRRFTSKDEVHTANKLITIKINKGLDDADIVLCKSSGRGAASDIYLVIYPEEGKTVVSIENFVPPQIGGSELSFFF